MRRVAGSASPIIERLEDRLQLSMAGTLDPLFAGNGILRKVYRDGGSFIDVAMQTDGKIVAVGQAQRSEETSDALIARFTADGRVDRTFGNNGAVFLGFGANFDDIATAVAIDSITGNIIVAGITGAESDTDMFVARFTTGGRLDATFGAGGRTRIDFRGNTDGAVGVVVQDDSKIVVSGFSGSLDDTSFAVAIARLQSNGRLDPSFGTGGRVLATRALPANSIEIGARMVQDNDGKYAVALTRVNFSPTGEIISSSMGVMRLRTNGMLDTPFGTAGRAFGRLLNQIQVGTSVAIDPATDNILLGGTTANGVFDFGATLPAGLTLPGVADATVADFAVARFNGSRGFLDRSFSGDGMQIVNFRSQGESRLDAATSVQVDSRSRVYLAGASLLPEQNPSFAVARLLSTGLPDPNFSGDGRVLLNIGGADVSFASDLLIDLDERQSDLLLAGQSNDNRGFNFAVLVSILT